MNLCITNLCNRRCEYCFQKEWFLANDSNDVREMDLELATKILEWYEGKHFKVMGGEPLLYRRLDDFMDLVISKNKTITVISNISIMPAEFNRIISKYGKDGPITSWLINTDYPKHQEDIFIKNFKTLVDIGTNITLSTTLLPNKQKIQESKERLRKLIGYTNFNSIKPLNVRVSPAEPNYKSISTNYNFTLDIMDIYMSLKRVKNTVLLGLDCPVNNCEVDYVFYRDRGLEEIRTKTTPCVQDMPFDVMPDGSVLWCSSAKFLKVNNILDYQNIDECKKELRQQYDEYWKNNRLLCDHSSCGKYGVCFGLCPAKNESLKFLNAKKQQN